jgi:tetratricopeptide (TPR) repeat protein
MKWDWSGRDIRRWMTGGWAVVLLSSPAGAQRPQPIEELARRAVADSNDPMAHYQLAMGYWEKKKWDEAERELRQSIVLSPQFADGYLALAVLPEKRGERYWRRFAEQRGRPAADSVFAESARYLQRAFLNNPLVDLDVLGEFNPPPLRVGPVDLGMVVTFWWMSDFKRAVNELRQSKNAEAYDRLEKMMTDPRASSDRLNVPGFILWHHGLAAARTGHLDQAIHDFAILTGRAFSEEEMDASLSVPIQTNDYRFTLATLYFLAGRLNEATATFRRVLEFDIGVYQAHGQLARIFEARQMWSEALSARRMAVATNPDDHTLLIDLGATLLRAGQLDEAMDILEQAAELGPRDPRAPYTLALAATQRQDYRTARAAFSRFLSLAPSSDSYQIGEARRRLAEFPPESSPAP